MYFQFLPKLMSGNYSRTKQNHELANTWRKRGKKTENKREKERNQDNGRDRRGSSRHEWEALVRCGKVSKTSKKKKKLESDCCIKKLLDLAFHGKRSQNAPKTNLESSQRRP